MNENMVFGAGQRRVYKEGENAPVFERLEYDKTEIVEGLPELVIHPAFADKNLVTTLDITEKIKGVNAEMIDWWWGNLEKGYLLWAPGEHYGFEWVVPPCEVGYEGSAEATYEFDPVHPMIITRVSMDKHYPYTECFEHCWVAQGQLGPIHTTLVHAYEDCEDGILWRTIQYVDKDTLEYMQKHPEMLTDTSSHIAYESGRLRYFLPDLYRLWKDHPDPWQNVRFDLRTYKAEDGTWHHVSRNLPPQK